MDPLTEISSLLKVISEINDRAAQTRTRRLDELISRIQYSKTCLELAAAVGCPADEEVRKLCWRDLADVGEELRKLGNKFVGAVTNVCAFFLWFVMDVIMLRSMTMTEDMIKRQFHGPEAQLINFLET